MSLVIENVAGRRVTAYVPRAAAEAVIFAGDGELIAPWGADLEAAGRPTLVVGAHRAADEDQRLREYSPPLDPERFAAHERFFTEDLFRSASVELPAARTAVLGVSAGGELALALGLRHPERYGAVLCASPGAGFPPPDPLPARLPRVYLVAGTQEPFFRDNAARWEAALRAAGADVVLRVRDGAHGGPFWRAELPRMAAWAFGGAG